MASGPRHRCARRLERAHADIEPQQRLSACVLAIASRLAPLDAGEPDRELRAFLTALPLPSWRPQSGSPPASCPAATARRAGQHGVEQVITERLRVLQLDRRQPGQQPVTGIAPVTWRESLPSLSDGAVTAVLTVQCGVDWLRPPAWRIRDEIDEAIMTAARTRDDLVIDRLVLHSVPVLDDVPAEELAALNAAHADWLYRLDAAGALLPRARRPRVHRLIVGGSQRNFGVVDGMICANGGLVPIPTLPRLR